MGKHLSGDLNPVLVPAAFVPPAKPPRPALVPLWLRRVWLVLYVLFCTELGMLLMALPWRAIWRANRFLADFPTLQGIFESYFFRGVVTGIGVIDLYLGATAILYYGVQSRQSRSAPPSASDSRPPE